MKGTKYSIEFHCPGSFVDEIVFLDVAKEDLNIATAVARAAEIRARHNSAPYGFVLRTATHEETYSDGKLCRSEPERTSSGMHYLDGTVLTLADIPNTPEYGILRENMECNDIPAVVRTENSWRHHGALGRNDIVLRGTEIVALGKDHY